MVSSHLDRLECCGDVGVVAKGVDVGC